MSLSKYPLPMEPLASQDLTLGLEEDAKKIHGMGCPHKALPFDRNLPLPPYETWDLDVVLFISQHTC